MKRTKVIKNVLNHVGETLNMPLSIQLWDGSKVALGKDQAAPELLLTVNDEAVVASLLKKPTLENAVRHYAVGNITFEGSDLVTFGQTVRSAVKKKDVKRLDKKLILKNLLPFLLVKGAKPVLQHGFDKDETGFNQKQRDNKDYIQFHYDVSNAFYQLFLDPEMQYSCAYFKEWDNSLEQAQKDKLDMICKKLRLKKGEKLLDIGCGWGGLLCHAVQHYGVVAHGVTLSQEQYDFATAKVKKLGLEDKITIEIRDYITLEGTYDKISSIGMFEHIGLDNFPKYFKKVNSLLKDGGIFLNHGIARRAKADKKKARHITPEKQLILKYIFPGSELAPIGFTLNSMESNGFEIHDVEAWREHYAITCKHWCMRLSANKEKAIALVGQERYNLWVAYLAGVSMGFNSGSILIFQTVSTKRAKIKGASGLPPTRANLYGGL